jgi:hypothetical protein
LVGHRLAAHPGSVARLLAIVASLFLQFRANSAEVSMLLAVGTGGIPSPDCVDFVAPRRDLIQVICSSNREGNLVLIL